MGIHFSPYCGPKGCGPVTALKYDIQLVFYGENVAEYGNNKDDNYSPLMDPILYTCFDFTPDTLHNYYLSGIPLDKLISEHGMTLNDLNPYKSPSISDVTNAGIEVHYMSYYRKWVPQENYYYAVKHTAFTPSEKRKDGSFTKYAGIDDVLEDLHYYMQLIKFGMGRATWDAAQEIRTGKLEREEAVALVNKYGNEEPKDLMDEILKYLNISIEEFRSTVDKFRTPNLWKKDNDRFSLRHPLT